ncbi:MAG: hypothetical protein ABGW82_10600, partial [Paracoccus sp. (in: a-proteobacteria)]
MRPAALLILAAGLAALAVAGPSALGRLALRAGWDGAAVRLLDDPAARGVALFRLGDYKAADEAFAAAGRGQTYNRGLSLAATREYALSVAYFDATLFANPTDDQARSNRDLVAALGEHLPHVLVSAEPATLRARRAGNLLVVAGAAGVPRAALAARARSAG